jgi:hypothetical protein
VYRRTSGNSWTKVGGPADAIYGGPSGNLYALNPDSRDIWRYDGSNWSTIGQP